MTAVRLGLSELRRLASGTLPRLAILAMALIPTLYAGLYLFANHDPYGRLDEIPAALVVLDEGTTTTDRSTGGATGEPVERDFGRDVADQLLDDGGFGWVETSQVDAEYGVRSGRYDAALVIGPTFSADLASAGEFAPQQASLTLVTNDANNYLARTIADQIVGKVRDSIAEQVGTEAADTFLRGFASIHTNLADAVDGAGRLLDGSTQLRDGLVTADDGAHTLADGAAQAADGAETLRSSVGPLADAAEQLDDGADRLATGLATLRDGTATLPDETRRLADGAAQVADGNAQVAQYGQQAAGAAAQVLPALDTVRDDVGTALDDRLGDLVDGVTQLRDGLAEGLGQVPDLDEQTRQDTAETIGNPVSVHNEALASAGTYGGGLAPFFLSLATWIGAYVLFLLVRPLSTRALAAGRSGLATALGGWLTPAAIGVVQVAAMFTVTKFALDIDPVHGVGTALFLVLVSATFVAILQALNVWLGAAGQFLGLVLMLVQLVTAGGTFPWQTIPQPLQGMHRFLPMTYAVEGLRQLLYGGNLATVARDVTVLAVVLAGALALTTVAARRQRVWTVTKLQPELVL
jgi:YhgE/Pip-like protein